MKGYEIEIKEVGPKQGKRTWFECKVTHIESGCISPEGRALSGGKTALRKVLEAQIKLKLNDPRCFSPVKPDKKRALERARNYKISET